jgi:endonuclease/exonuclease/phosphatase (EEP) superfamily protein YafD
MIEPAAIAITEPHLASNESRDDLMQAYIEVSGKRLHLWAIHHDSNGVTRIYRDREQMREHSRALQLEALEGGAA